VAPVVVTPDIDSKNASVIFGIAPDRKKGKAPTIAVNIQEKVTIAKPSRFVRVLLWRVKYHIGNPKIMHPEKEIKKPVKSFSPYPYDINIGNIIVKPNIIKSPPRVFKRILNLMKRKVFLAL
jgi:hypothetical protein